jgi:DNA repair protein RadD
VFKLRSYQQEVSDALFTNFEDMRDDQHPVGVVPTGGGKTPIICDLVDQVLSDYPTEEILVLSHVREILEQDYNALVSYFEGVDIGLYSAGLNSRTVKRITVAGIQSVWRHPELFENVGLVIIDECHMIPIDEGSMYRQFLESLEFATYVGLTATPYRLGHGYIHKGEGALFTDIVIDYSEFEKFNWLIDEGYLSQIHAPDMKAKVGYEMDPTGVKKQAGDYKTSDLSKKFDRGEITKLAIDECIRYKNKFKKWLIFAIDIKHAENIAAELNHRGVKTLCVHSQMDDGREQAIQDYRDGKYQAAVNVDIMTTGLDVPDIDMIVLLRPTQSPIFHVQSIGRLLRVVFAKGYDLTTKEGRLAAIKAGGKPFGFVLDFAGNTKRLGPINDVVVKQKKKRDGKGGDPITKTCPNCSCICHATLKTCPACNFSFEIKEKITQQASELAIIKRKQDEQKRLMQEKEEAEQAERMKAELREKQKKWVEIVNVEYNIHNKVGSRSSLKVTYDTGLQKFSEWVNIDHHSIYARRHAQNWVRVRLPHGMRKPQNLNELVSIQRDLKVPKRVYVDVGPKFPEILDLEF